MSHRLTGSLPFVKMHGAGNDYVYLDGIRASLDVDSVAGLVTRLADRHTGIGGDGVILLAPSDVADCRMVMWNADGSRGRMCGNGLRCLAKLAVDTGAVRGDTLDVETDSGVKRVRLLRGANGRIDGATVELGPVDVDTTARAFRWRDGTVHYHRAAVGSPHAVIFGSADPALLPVVEIGRALQVHPDFPDGVNVEFVAVRDGVLVQRTFERGSGETLACGSGATAAAIAAIRTGRVPGPRVEVRLLGGTLVIEDTPVGATLTGPARTAFDGTFDLDADSAGMDVARRPPSA